MVANGPFAFIKPSRLKSACRYTGAAAVPIITVTLPFRFEALNRNVYSLPEAGVPDALTLLSVVPPVLKPLPAHMPNTAPLAMATGATLRREVMLVPVLRAGLGMLPAILQLVPHARVGFVGLKRHHRTLKAAVYHKSLPDQLGSSEIVLIDPMLATGGSVIAALKLFQDRGAERVRLVSLVASPEGIARVHQLHPNLPIFTAALDRKLDRRGYIVPGLGDAGDRLFGVQ